MSRPEDFKKWQRQIEELADHAERDLIHNPQIFACYKKMLDKNDTINFPNGTDFHLWVERNHYYALLAAIRKIFLTTDKNEISLCKIIEQMLGSGRLFTRTSYPKLMGWDNKEPIIASVASSASKGFFDEKGNLSEAKLNLDLDFLKNELRPELKFINEKVLHIQKNPKAIAPTEEELNRTIKKLLSMLQEYRTFLTGNTTLWYEDDLDWAIIFTIPWTTQSDLED